MNERELLNRISINPQVLCGKPVIRGTRLSVDFILNLLAHGSDINEIVDEYNGIVPEDIYACLLFATESIRKLDFMPLVQTA